MTSNRARECPVCACRDWHDFFELTSAPVTCASVFDSAAEARATPAGDIHLVICCACAFVFNRSFDPQLGDAGARYQSSQAASAHFSTFAKSLADDWIRRYSLFGKSVLEVGCGSGDFLRQLLAGGIARGAGLDPLAVFEETNPNAQSLQLIAERFDENHLELPADALVCRHTLEHIPNVRDFLGWVNQWARRDANRVVLFEIPDAQRVFTERAFWDIYYEHCNYFTAQTLRFAFESAGFQVLSLVRAYNDQYLILEAVASQDRRSIAPIDAYGAKAACIAFGVDVRQSIERCQSALADLYGDAQQIILWQGASKTVGFLTALRCRSMIGGAIDLNPQRHGKFLPGSALPVFAPQALRRLRPRHIVLMNPIYLDEVRKQVMSLDVNSQVHSVNTLLS